MGIAFAIVIMHAVWKADRDFDVQECLLASEPQRFRPDGWEDVPAGTRLGGSAFSAAARIPKVTAPGT